MMSCIQKDKLRKIDDTCFSIIIPTFNEGEGIGEVLRTLCEEPTLTPSEIIVVDDGSDDDTAEIAAAFGRVELIRHGINRGYGSALVTGMRKASREFVLWMDSDGQHRIEDLCTVKKCMQEHDLDYCIGVRGASSYQEPNRKFGKWVLKQAVRLAVGRNVGDFNSGLRGFRREFILRYLHLLPARFGASTTTTLLMLERNYRGAEIPITVLRRSGKSSVRQVSDGIRTVVLILRIFLLFKPLHFFGAAGLILSIFGLTYGLWSALTEGLGFPVLGAVVLLFGVQTGFLGLLMDQISAMRRERFERE